jgi:hypothetical protein
MRARLLLFTLMEPTVSLRVMTGISVFSFSRRRGEIPSAFSTRRNDTLELKFVFGHAPHIGLQCKQATPEALPMASLGRS